MPVPIALHIYIGIFCIVRVCVCVSFFCTGFPGSHTHTYTHTRSFMQTRRAIQVLIKSIFLILRKAVPIYYNLTKFAAIIIIIILICWVVLSFVHNIWKKYVYYYYKHSMLLFLLLVLNVYSRNKLSAIIVYIPSTFELRTIIWSNIERFICCCCWYIIVYSHWKVFL